MLSTPSCVGPAVEPLVATPASADAPSRALVSPGSSESDACPQPQETPALQPGSEAPGLTALTTTAAGSTPMASSEDRVSTTDERGMHYTRLHGTTKYMYRGGGGRQSEQLRVDRGCVAD